MSFILPEKSRPENKKHSNAASFIISPGTNPAPGKRRRKRGKASKTMMNEILS
jgi:hypothetical protein